MKIRSKKVWCNSQFLPLTLHIEGDKITSISDNAPSEKVDYDFGEERILPGFIDIHTHGAFGFDATEVNEEGLRRWTKQIPSEGVTAFLPTTIAQPEEVLLKAVANIAKVHNEGYQGAEILGIHLEGPYLNPEKRGAQPLHCILSPDVAQFKRFQQASNNLIKLVTLACEQDTNYELTKYLANEGIRVSLGHSTANYHQSCMAFANGATSQTHVFNGMTGFHHREGGQVGFALRNHSVYGEIVCDGIHSTPDALHIYFEAKGRDHGIMITDSLYAKGCGKGTYQYDGEPLEIYEDGSAHLANGTLAGSTLRIIDGLRILIEDALVPVETAINACTKNPAEMLGFGNRKGKLKVGYDADLVVISKEYKVLKTFTKGNVAFSI
ncbi:N-acetylglucosamine-6-phosphate deacetylase [Capnocytophaga sp. HP1101]